MFRVALALLFLSPAFLFPVAAQEATGEGLRFYRDANGSKIPMQSAWLDLRQAAAKHTTPQDTPSWVESVALVPVPAEGDKPARSIFRIRVVRPQFGLQLMYLRLFFDDKPERRPAVTIWDESGTQIMQSGPLGTGMDLPTAATVMLPMLGTNSIDIEVAGDGSTIRGAFLDWMVSRTIAQPSAAETQAIMPEPFAAAAPLRVPQEDTENFGTVTATLAPEVIKMGASVQAGAAFQFGLESQPLVALLSFEVASVRIDAPPEVFVNGASLGAASLVLPDLADPAYRGETERLVSPMRFRYTGWVRAHLLVPAAHLKPGTNDVIIIGGPGTPASAIRATQIQLKYLWEKSDYLLDPK